MRTLVVLLLAALAAGCGFVKFQCKSRQSEAKTNLKTIQASLVTHFAEKRRYPITLRNAGFVPQGEHYDYKLVKADPMREQFTVEATGKGAMEGDRWTIDQLGVVSATADACD